MGNLPELVGARIPQRSVHHSIHCLALCEQLILVVVSLLAVACPRHGRLFLACERAPCCLLLLDALKKR